MVVHLYCNQTLDVLHALIFSACVKIDLLGMEVWSRFTNSSKISSDTLEFRIMCTFTQESANLFAIEAADSMSALGVFWVKRVPGVSFAVVVAFAKNDLDLHIEHVTDFPCFEMICLCGFLMKKDDNWLYRCLRRRLVNHRVQSASFSAVVSPAIALDEVQRKSVGTGVAQMLEEQIVVR